MYLSYAQFARLNEVDPVSISEQVRKGKIEKTKSNRISTKNKTVQLYMSKHGITNFDDDYLEKKLKKIESKVLKSKQKIVNKPKKSRQSRKTERYYNDEDNEDRELSGEEQFYNEYSGVPPNVLKDLEKMSIKKLIVKYGSVARFRSIVDVLKLTAEYQKRELDNQIKKGDIIEREFVKVNLFTLLETMIAKLFELPQSQADFIIARIKSSPDKAREFFITHITKSISKIISETKKQLKKALRKKGINNG